MFRIFAAGLVVWVVGVVCCPASAGEKGPAKPSGEKPLGTLSGRFILPGKPPEPRLIPIDPRRSTTDGREFRVDELVDYAALKLVDESLLVHPTGGVKNVIIWLSDKNLPSNESPPNRRTPPPATLTFQGGKLIPRVLVFEHWRPLEVASTDRWTTNLRWSGVQSPGFNRILPPPKPTEPSHFYEKLLAEKLPQRIHSDIHPWVEAWVFPVAHPYYAVSRDDGSFQIERLPPGEWEFTAWHECWGYLRTEDWPRGRFTRKITDGSNALGEIRLSRDSMLKK